MQSSEPGSGDSYGVADRILHQIALGFRPILSMSFDIEKGRHGKAAAAIADPRPVFVTGLARAGTTVLMRMLHGTGEFASLSYRELPFPLAPASWAKMSGGAKRNVETRERGHGDGLTHDLDSPEAIEEVFWRAFEGGRYLKRDGLYPTPPEGETMKDFGDYVRLVLHHYGKPRYLSKNNNNILRLPALVQVFPSAVLIHPFRDPLQQAASLLNQHVRARDLAKGDAFRRKFMSWLGHHEFGGDHRPFKVGPRSLDGLNPDGIDYWLAVWINAYSWLLEQPAEVAARQSFVDYDALCATPERLAPELARAAGIAPEAADPALFRVVAPRPVEGADQGLVAAAASVHSVLKARSAQA